MITIHCRNGARVQLHTQRDLARFLNAGRHGAVTITAYEATDGYGNTYRIERGRTK